MVIQAGVLHGHQNMLLEPGLLQHFQGQLSFRITISEG